jgi:hypothetical protein
MHHAFDEMLRAGITPPAGRSTTPTCTSTHTPPTTYSSAYRRRRRITRIFILKVGTGLVERDDSESDGRPGKIPRKNENGIQRANRSTRTLQVSFCPGACTLKCIRVL